MVIQGVDLETLVWVDYQAPPLPKDTVGVTDEIVLTPLYSIAPNDSVSTSDAFSAVPDNLRPGEDAAALDQATLTMTYVREFAETVSASEALANTPSPVFADSVTPSEAADIQLQSATFVSASTGSGTTVNGFGSATVGDLGVVYCQNSSGTKPSPGTGFTQITEGTWPTYGYGWRAFYKVLDATDISSGRTFANTASWAVYVVRGPTVATLVEAKYSTTASLAFAGFTKGAGAKAVLTFVGDRSTAGTHIQPAGCTLRTTGVQGFFEISVADILPASGYVDGTVLTWTGLAGVFEEVGLLLEVA